MNHSKLSEQIVNKKKGLILSPWINSFGDRMVTTSWSTERLPEYIWLALILDQYGRSEGINKCLAIIRETIAQFPDIPSGKMSDLLCLEEHIQKSVFQTIEKHIEKRILAPLTLIIDESVNTPFFTMFFTPIFSVEKRISKLQEVTKKYYESDSYEATDLRYLALVLLLMTGKLKTYKGAPELEALLNYGTTDHNDEIMRIYRPAIRATENTISMIPSNGELNFVEMFWKKMRNLTGCSLHKLVYEKKEDTMNYQEFIEKTKEAFNYLNIENKNLTVTDDAYSVMTGSLAYALKTFDEVINHNLGNTIIGRQSARIIIEVYIMMKYLLGNEQSNPLIWRQYKAYGIGKYKLILLKMRDGKGGSTTHINEPILDALVNEPQSEEFTSIDLKYFDDVKIREKADKVGEKDLYDIAYDYDSSFAHGLWGAVRESSMLCCDNVFHHFHPVADATLEQNLPDVTADSFNYLLKLIHLTNNKYPFPEWYVKYLEEIKSEQVS